MNIDEIKCIEAQMRAEALQMVSEERFALDQVDSSTRMRITKILGNGAHFTDFWLVSPCSYLGSKRPLDVLKGNHGKVIAAAVRKQNWVNPG